MKIALLTGGPSAERGIALNSARSVLDHLAGTDVEIVPFYFDARKTPYRISPAQLYSNTPSDFDFKLRATATKLGTRSFLQALKACDLVFPVIHGTFGEDGQIQSYLERHRLPFIGSPAAACKRAFDKYNANEFIRDHGFFAPPSVVLKIYHSDHRAILTKFFREEKITRAIVKPASGGSSIGVFSVGTVEEALEKVQFLFSKRVDTRVVVEPFCTGIEFTVILLQNRFGIPVAILPTEIEADYQNHQIFDYRKKYLPTRQVRYHCPPRFSNETIERIQVQAEQLFTLLGMRDFARFDGWLLPDGNIWFSDFNPVSGMEQNSFLFQQTSRLGFSHRDTLRYVLKNAARRHGFPLADRSAFSTSKRKIVPVLFGGTTSERQVSLMSGTNIWLKLRRSKKYLPKPFLLDTQERIWELPYSFTLNHTVEEIEENCEQAKEAAERLRFLEEKVQLRLALEPGDATEKIFLPHQTSLQKLAAEYRFIFLALHGGAGENGTYQEFLAKKKVEFNGSDANTSRLLMDKFATGKALAGLESQGIWTAPKVTDRFERLLALTPQKLQSFWDDLQKQLGSRTIIVKPQSEGCSSGIVRLFEAKDLQTYLRLMRDCVPQIPSGTFKSQETIIEMPPHPSAELLFEKFITTDKIRIRANRLQWHRKYGRIEVTVGVLELNKKITVLNPSLTVAAGEVLSVEEKFQGGTGINITPPPPEILAPQILQKVKDRIGRVTKQLGISGYARIDVFVETDTGEITVIEANSLPALTPSTVLFHQGLAEKPPLLPIELLERIIENSGY